LKCIIFTFTILSVTIITLNKYYKSSNLFDSYCNKLYNNTDEFFIENFDIKNIKFNDDFILDSEYKPIIKESINYKEKIYIL